MWLSVHNVVKGTVVESLWIDGIEWNSLELNASPELTAP